MNDDDLHPCIGVCQNDPLTGICIGCGRLPDSPAEAAPPADDDIDQAGGSGVHADPAASKNK